MRVRPAAIARAAAIGSRGRPSARGSTLVPPPGTNPSTVSGLAPFSDLVEAAVAGEDDDRIGLRVAGELGRVPGSLGLDDHVRPENGFATAGHELGRHAARVRIHDQRRPHERGDGVAAHAVDEDRGERVGERVGVAARRQPGVGPVRGREDEQRRRASRRGRCAARRARARRGRARATAPRSDGARRRSPRGARPRGSATRG